MSEGGEQQAKEAATTLQKVQETFILSHYGSKMDAFAPMLAKIGLIGV